MDARIPIPRELAADMAAAARNEEQRQRGNQRAFVVFAAVTVAIAALALLLAR
jgi:hypothetical protein